MSGPILYIHCSKTPIKRTYTNKRGLPKTTWEGGTDITVEEYKLRLSSDPSLKIIAIGDIFLEDLSKTEQRRLIEETLK